MNPSDEQQREIHRLLDIEVQEVSLVDRAANKHRFLIVKRSDDMSETRSPETPEDDTNFGTDEAEKAHDAMPTWGGEEAPSSEDQPSGMHGAALAAAVEALQRLTVAVEMLESQDEASSAGLVELARELHHVADQLAATAGSAEDVNQGALLGDAEEVLAQAKQASDPRPRANAVAQEARRAGPSPDPDNSAIGKQLGELIDAVRSLTGTVTAQQQRLSKLEKGFGMPNSRSLGERPAQRDADTGWPLDLNQPFDRASVDKAVSFHDV